MEYFYSKYTGEELEERLDRIDDIPELLAEMLTGKNYTTPEDALCIVKKYVPTIYENIPIDNNTIYWANTNDGKVLKARIILSDTDAEGKCLWEKKTNIDGKEYLYSKLPVVTAEGITMYADGEDIDIPSIYAGIPFDGVTIHFNEEGKVEVIGGSGEGVSNFWDLRGIPSWITNTKPTYSYSEIQGTPDLSKYALVSQIPSLEGYAKLTDIPSLSGYATQAWVNQQGFLKEHQDLSGYQTKITSTNKLSYSLISGTPDLSVYALKSAIPSLNGYATESWVLGKGYATVSDLDGRINSLINGAPQAYDTLKEIADVLQGNVNSIGDIITTLGGKADKATTLGGYGITDAYTKTNVDNLLKAYVTLAGTQTITGEKDFTGGLKVNGSPIVYDSRGFWKLEGDLLVTGGVTMYGSDTAFTPSTIMDAIVVDGVTIIKQDGKLVAIGGGSTGGGVADSVSWGNVLGKPSWITESAPIIGISGVNVSLGSGISQSSLRTALGLGSLAYKSSLGKADVGLGNVENTALSTWTGTNKITTLGTITTGTWNGTKITNDYLANNKVSISGVDVSLGGSITQSALRTALGLGSNAYTSTAYLPLTGGTLSDYTETPLILKGTYSENVLLHLYNKSNIATSIGKYGAYTFLANYANGNGTGELEIHDDGRLTYARGGNNYSIWHSGNDGSESGLDADLLDGKHLSDILASNVASATKLQTTRYIWGQSFDGTGNIDGSIVMKNNSAFITKDTNGINLTLLQLNNNNAFSIGYGSAGAGYETYIDGEKIYLRFGTSRINGLLLNSSGNITIGSSDLAGTSCKLCVNGDTLVKGGLTFNSMRSLKNIQDERGLSLDELSTIKPTRFTWKDGRDNKIHIGGIADDVQKVLPEVIYNMDNVLCMDYGNAAFAIAASLIKPVVNHEERIKVLEEENERLKREIEQLKWHIA